MCSNMTRRQFLSATLATLSNPVIQAAVARPNVLLISVDDMNDWVGCLGGYPGVSTPNIDRLAKRGALFADAHCASPLCNPSRTALLTGQGPATTGIYNNDQFWRASLPQAVTLPQYFKKNGYFVAGAGKVFHHTAGNNPPDQWDEFQLQIFDDPWYRRADWYPWNKREPVPAAYPYNGIPNFAGEFDWGTLPKEEQLYGDQRAIDFGINVLNRKLDKPFFLAVGLWHPHIPMFSPKQYWDLYPPEKVHLPPLLENDLDDLPKVGKEFAAFRRDEHEAIVRAGKWKEGVHAYLAAISFADAMIGRLLDALDNSPHAGNTNIVFFSDNGWHLGEKEHWHKSTLWQRATHVPMIIAGPQVKSRGVTRRQPVSLLDLYPTLVDLCGLPKKSELEGKSLIPLLKNPREKRQPAVSTYLPGNHAVITEQWRYIRYNDGGEELYNRKTDPNEFHNLALKGEYTQLKRDMAQWMPKQSAEPQPDRKEFDFDFATYTFKRK